MGGSGQVSQHYLPQRDGGLNLPSPSSLYQCLQVSRQCQLLTSADPTVRFIAEENLKLEMASKRKKFRPAMVVQEVMKDDPSQTRRALRIASMRKVKMDEDESRLENLKGLPRQGQMMRISTPEAASTWAKSIQSLPQHVFKFVLNATHDVLPHNANLHLVLPLCHQPDQNLIHVLNNCKDALDLRQYDDGHNQVLQAMANIIQDHLPSSTSMTVDLSDGYSFPTHIAATDLRPDIVWWNDDQKILTLVELTVCLACCDVSSSSLQNSGWRSLRMSRSLWNPDMFGRPLDPTSTVIRVDVYPAFRVSSIRSWYWSSFLVIAAS